LLIVGEVVDKADKLNWVTRVTNRVPKQAAGSDV
jgi:hypothetical protein